MSGVDFQTYIRKNSDGTASKYRIQGRGHRRHAHLRYARPDPAAQGQQHDLDPQRLRSSRFIHLSDTEMRRAIVLAADARRFQGFCEGKWMQLAPRRRMVFATTLTGARKTDATKDMPATPAPSEPCLPNRSCCRQILRRRVSIA